MTVKAYLSLARLDHWGKNAFVIAGTGFAVFFRPSLWTASSAIPFGLALFSALRLSSANYVLNEIVDAPTDREHPAKRNRALVQGLVSSKIAWVTSGLLYVFGLTLAFSVRPALGLTAVAFCLAAWAYNLLRCFFGLLS